MVINKSINDKYVSSLVALAALCEKDNNHVITNI